MRWRTRHGKHTDGYTDNMQCLVWPVHRTFVKQLVQGPSWLKLQWGDNLCEMCDITHHDATWYLWCNLGDIFMQQSLEFQLKWLWVGLETDCCNCCSQHCTYYRTQNFFDVCSKEIHLKKIVILRNYDRRWSNFYLSWEGCMVSSMLFSCRLPRFTDRTLLQQLL